MLRCVETRGGVRGSQMSLRSGSSNRNSMFYTQEIGRRSDGVKRDVMKTQPIVDGGAKEMLKASRNSKLNRRVSKMNHSQIVF